MSLWLLVLLLFSIPILFIIFAPVKYEAGFSYHDNFKLYAGIRQGYFFRLAFARNEGKTDFDLRIFNIPLPASREAKPAKSIKPKKKVKPTPRSSSPLAVFRSLIRHKTYRPLGKLLSRLLRDIKPEQLRLEGEYGFYEPHYTAWAYTLLLLLSSDSPNYQIQVEPVWNDEMLDIEGYIKGSVTLAGMTWHLIRFILSPSFLKFIIDLYRYKKAKAKTKVLLQPSI